MIKEIEHSHLPDPVDVEVRTVKNNIKESARNCNDSTNKVVSKEIGTLSDAASAKMPSINALSRTVQKLRTQKMEAFPINGGLSGMVVPEIYKVTNKNKNFLLHNSDDGNNRLCNNRHADGTFKCVPLIFSQLYTIHGLVGSKTIPLVYMLLPNKSKKIYKSALDVLKNMLKDCMPEEIIIDFEKAFIISFQSIR